MHFTSLVALVTCSLLPSALGVKYGLVDNWIGAAFLSTFVHENIPDPTHGRVNYVDQATALAQNLTYAQGDAFVIRADHTTVLSPSGPGRNSVRVRSVKTYTTHVAVFDIAHMPEGCGTWPATWETAESNWPYSGEIDIGVNNVSPNSISLHTGPNCTVPASRSQTGTSTGNNCDVFSSGNTGCGVSAGPATTYGPPFNAAGGGWWAVERTPNFIKVWFWQRNAAKPGDIGAASINTDNWGTPVAYFPNTSCDIGGHFGPNNIIINLTFCGDWADAPSVYSSSGCPSTCVDYVNNNPAAFNNAYWQFNSVRVYQ
ncbi:putative laminarinase [Trametopsis cervina]|nr:putative laminarinase [Trametopsis cervina]